VLTIIIGIVVVTIGYFSYQSLSKIIDYIQQGTHPDNKIFVVKEIDSDLNALENTVRLYALTNNYDVLEVFYAHEDNITQNLKVLNGMNVVNKYDLMLIDSISVLSQQKLELWNEILNIYLSKKGIFPAFSKLYSNLDEKKPDTISIDSQQIDVAENVIADSTSKEPSIERKEIKKKIQKLEWEIYKNSKKKNVRETQLIEENVALSKRITSLISKAETREQNALLQKTAEADRLAKITYKRLTEFTASAILLLLFALFVLFNYLRKARSAQRALAKARENAESLAHAKEQFAANVSHELRTPVNAIYGLTEQVLQKKLDTKVFEMISIIFKSAGHLKSIINDTLDFSKIQSGSLVPEADNFSPFALIEEVYLLFKFEANDKGIALKFHWEGDNPVALTGDALRLKQILINLVGNAIKFTKKGEVTIKARCLQKGDQKFELEIQVIDTGIGIEENKLNVVFDEYVQIGDRTKKKNNGTGLGLSIVKKLVDMHGGKIKLESIQGVGTRVLVNIDYPEGETLKAELENNGIPEIPGSFQKLSVLIADDEEYNLFLLKNILLKWGVQVKEAINGHEVVLAACNSHFDFILMDINMPEMNGIEAAKEILKCDADVQIIAVTAATEMIDQQACFEAGMKGFLIKPFTEKDLFEKINLLIHENLGSTDPNSPKPSIDISELRRLAGNDEKFLEEMIGLFIKAMETGISAIDEALKTENTDIVYENAHKMAAPIKHIGAGELYKNIKHLEKISKQPVSVSTISAVFIGIKNEIESINAMLKLYLDDRKLK
jgi:signal transduction histidine kinase/FixJ family two-component response regulator/CHASE3 domain sensor protein